MSRYSNQMNIPLPLAVFLATDDYDYDPTAISATALMKPIRQLILTKRVNPEDNPIDIAGLVSSRMGSAIHAAIEKAWLTPKNALKALGMSSKLIENVVINPSKPMLELNPSAIPIYMEQRAYKHVGNYKVSGKFDFVAEGRVQDFKSTSVYSYLNQTSVTKYSLQGSLYRWLNPDIIHKDDMVVNYIFTDWSTADAKQKPEYPQARVLTQRIPLISVEDTQAFVEAKLKQIEKYKDAKESDIPYCTDEDLWRKATVWKYYKHKDKTDGRSTKNFDNSADAYARLADDGYSGIVVEVKGQVVACRYCNAFSVCTQKDNYLLSGDLVLN
jgi:hypothetical protein